MFRRRYKIKPTQHTAYIYIKNDHFGVEQFFDLSHLDYDTMQTLLQIIDEIDDLSMVETVGDIGYE